MHVEPFKLHPYYEGREGHFSAIASHPNQLKKERECIRRKGLATNQKRGLLDNLSRIPKDIDHVVFVKGEFKGFAVKK